MKQQIIVVTSAYGNDVVQQLGGQAALLPLIAKAGADGVEIRRELLSPQELDDLPALARAMQQHQLAAVYSAPESLFTPQHTLNPNLPAFLAEAKILQASRLKLALGHYQPGFDFTELKIALGQSATQLVVENDQTPDCGILSLMNAFFHAVEASQLPVGMTFDMANWHWVEQNALAAANLLAAHVGYIHVKAATLGPRGWHAIALDDTDGSWRAVLGRLPQDVPRGIEFPLQGSDLEAVTRHYVDVLRGEQA
jgi:sugar phosphate isomerase/epimerase